MVRRRPAKKTLHGFERAQLLAAALLRSRTARRLAASTPVQRPYDWRIRPTPRRGPPVATIKAPRWHWQALWWNERRPRGPEPRGPLRGGPERSAGDPQRTPHDSPCGGPARSSDDPRLSKTTQAKAKREAKGEKGAKWPIVVTVDKDGKEKTWGPLSRTAAWKVGCYWDEMRRQGLPREEWREKGNER